MSPSPALRFEAIGTSWQIDADRAIAPETAAGLFARIDRFDASYSRFRPDSLAMLAAGGPARIPFPEDAGPLFSLYRKLYDATDGAVTPFVGASLERLGYDREYSFVQRGEAVAAPGWDETARWDGDVLEVSAPAVIDVGAAGKGYLVDLLGGLLERAGHAAYTIDASGDLLQRGGEPLRIALEHPYDASKAIGVATIADGALCASATNRRAWGPALPAGSHRLHHVIDGRTGLPTRTVVATWACASSALLADGLATALFFADHGTLASRFDFESVRMFTDGLVDVSRGFPGEVFT